MARINRRRGFCRPGRCLSKGGRPAAVPKNNFKNKILSARSGPIPLRHHLKPDHIPSTLREAATAAQATAPPTSVV
ncbi:hypothetical protein BLTE_34990 [Blastochloris tepida]|uniref:Uncharacterized protein n=1 Tax=Blastochloris tepida TaxID=2233851 RepID=A0A348G5I1_9HYPH|nr:hypothetical protein BLTE_34990 [Blastochloris tepida]